MPQRVQTLRSLGQEPAPGRRQPRTRRDCTSISPICRSASSMPSKQPAGSDRRPVFLGRHQLCRRRFRHPGGPRLQGQDGDRRRALQRSRLGHAVDRGRIRAADRGRRHRRVLARRQDLGKPSTRPPSASATSTTLPTPTKPVSGATQTALNLKANIASPTLTGDPKAPTPPPGDNDTSIATTAFVAASFAPIMNPTFGGNPQSQTPPPGDNDLSIATTAFVQGEIAGKAPINSPTFTGDPKAPTPPLADADTSIATTKFVKDQGYLTDAPSDGLVYGRKNALWSTVIGGAHTDDNPPLAPLQDGQLWWKSSTGAMFIWYDDGNSQQWVQVAGTLELPYPLVRATAQARNRMVNPAMQISQENGNTLERNRSGSYLRCGPVEPCPLNHGGATIRCFEPPCGSRAKGSVNRHCLVISTADAILGAADYLSIRPDSRRQSVSPICNGALLVRETVDLALWLAQSPPEPYLSPFRNGAANDRSLLVADFTVSAGQANLTRSSHGHPRRHDRDMADRHRRWHLHALSSRVPALPRPALPELAGRQQHALAAIEQRHGDSRQRSSNCGMSASTSTPTTPGCRRNGRCRTKPRNSGPASGTGTRSGVNELSQPFGWLRPVVTNSRMLSRSLLPMRDWPAHPIAVTGRFSSGLRSSGRPPGHAIVGLRDKL